MSLAALVTWILTAAGGFVLLGTWLARGGTRRPRTSRFPPALVFGHFGVAAAGLVVWIIALLTTSRTSVWVALVLVLLAAVLGFGLLARWIPVRRSANGEPPEKHFAVPVVVAHGVFAVATVVLVLLTALGVAAGGA